MRTLANSIAAFTEAGDCTSNDLVREAKLADGSQAYVKLKREPGADEKGAVLKSVKYFNAAQNDGFDRSIEQRADLEGHQFSYSDRKRIPYARSCPKSRRNSRNSQQDSKKRSRNRCSRKGPMESAW